MHPLPVGNSCNHEVTGMNAASSLSTSFAVTMVLAFVSALTRAGYWAKHPKNCNTDVIITVLKIRKIEAQRH